MQDKTPKIRFEVPVSALEKWDKTIKAADDNSGVSINIYSTIGEYGDGTGMTAKIVSAILRKADGAAVTVNINSGGGDFFEGLAIHSLLSEYEGDVNVRVLGLAASAASIVAMAGKNIEVAKSGFIMIHNAWTMAIGNKDDFTTISDMLAKFDKSMAELYAKKTGLDEKKIAKMMAEETWISGQESLDLNFASALLGEDQIASDSGANDNKQIAALRRLDIALAKAGVPRSERRELVKNLTNSGTPCASETVTPCADKHLVDALSGLLKTIKI